ncbi:MAG: hypothetical protein R3F35_14900 [Myxococcota bacterium]
MSRAAALPAAVLLILVAACATRPAPEAAPLPVPYQLIASPVDRATLSEVERRGFDLHLRVIAALRGTDAALAEVDLARIGALGRIVVPYEQGLLVRFIDDKERAVVDVSVDPFSALRPYVMAHPLAESLPPRDRGMWRALQVAMHRSAMDCSDRYHGVVIPAGKAPGSDWLVYLIAATPDPSRIMLGGHHRFRIDFEGTTIREQVPLSESCRSVQYTEATTTLAFTASHPAEPVETEVFLNRLHGIPIEVSPSGGRGHWTIEDGRIHARAGR